MWGYVLILLVIVGLGGLYWVMEPYWTWRKNFHPDKQGKVVLKTTESTMTL